MATVTPVRSSPATGVSKIFWEACATGDTITADPIVGTSAIFASVQVTGTFGSATVVLQGSNDATNYVTLKDVNGAAISFTAAGAVEFATSMLHIKPGISGGTGDDVDVTVVLRE